MPRECFLCMSWLGGGGRARTRTADARPDPFRRNGFLSAAHYLILTALAKHGSVRPVDHVPAHAYGTTKRLQAQVCEREAKGLFKSLTICEAT